MKKKTIPIFLFALAANLACQAVAAGYADPQPSGQILGKVVDDGGASVAGASVMAILEGDSKPFSTATVSRPDGSFSIGKLPAGNYRLCAEKRQAGMLNPCAWFDNQPTTAVAEGQSVTGAAVQTVKGYLFTLKVQDQGGVLKKNEGATPATKLLISAASAGNRYHFPETVSDDKGKTVTLLVPYDTPFDLMVFSSLFALADEKGNGVAGPALRIPVSVAQGAKAGDHDVEITVTGCRKQ